MKVLRILPVLLLLIDGCIDPLDLPAIRSTPTLVVDGMISDQPGPYEVKLYLSSSLNDDLDNPETVTNATVKITDDIGNEETLTHTAAGLYKTSAAGIQGTIGRTYQVHITTADGKSVESEPAKLTTAGAIDTVYFELKQNYINPNDPSKPQHAVLVYVDAIGDDGSPNLLRWRWTGTYQVHTYPELHMRFFEGVGFPDPLPCSGMIFEEGELRQIAPCECCDCWLTQYNTNALISPNEYAADARFNRIQIAQIPVEKNVFFEKFFFQIDQVSIQESVYDFWKLVNVQQQGTESIFQPNIVKIKGNMHSVSDADDEVFGIFSVSAIKKTSFQVKRSDLPILIPAVDVSPSDCRITFPGSTNQRPSFW